MLFSVLLFIIIISFLFVLHFSYFFFLLYMRACTNTLLSQYKFISQELLKMLVNQSIGCLLQHTRYSYRKMVQFCKQKRCFSPRLFVTKTHRCLTNCNYPKVNVLIPQLAFLYTTDCRTVHLTTFKTCFPNQISTLWRENYHPPTYLLLSNWFTTASLLLTLGVEEAFHNSGVLILNYYYFIVMTLLAS